MLRIHSTHCEEPIIVFYPKSEGVERYEGYKQHNSKSKKTLDTHRVDEGKYVRWLWDDVSQRDLGVNEYGCADAANILYTLNEFISEPEKRKNGLMH